MDVCLHYTGGEYKSNDLVFISKKALEDFPLRVLPVFTPWFPFGTEKCRPIKPQKASPVILFNQQKSSEFSPQQEESVFSENRCTDDQKKSGGNRKRKLTSIPVPANEHPKAELENVAKRCKRSWSVYTPKSKTPQMVQYISRQFQKTVQQYGLDLHQRAKWIISEVNCEPHGIEEVWSRLNQAIKHTRLPTCNANYQRNLFQIWVYCDISWCEYIGNFLRETFQLSGELTLAVHKLGDIFKL